MNAVLLTAPGRLELRDVPAPATPEGWLRVRMRRVGICGSDLHYFTTGRIGDQVVKFPFVLGHEGSGEVIDGAGWLQIDTPVYLEPAISCGACDQCRDGRENTCRRLQFMGNPQELPGCLAEEVVMPPACIVPLPEGMGLDAGMLLEPLAIGVYAAERAGAAPGCKAAVIGAGPIGLSVLLGLERIGQMDLFISEPVAARRAAAATFALGATVLDPGASGAGAALYEASGGGADVVFECAGTQAALDDAARMVRPGGVIALIGIPEDTDRLSFDSHLGRRKEITMMHIRRQNASTQKAVGVLAQHPDLPGRLITHRFAPARAQAGFELVRSRGDGVVKAVVEFP